MRPLACILVGTIFLGCGDGTLEEQSSTVTGAVTETVVDDEKSDIIGEERAIEIVREYHQKELDQGLVMTCDISREESGFTVAVVYGSGFDENGNIKSFPGGHALFTISSSGEILRVIGGA